MKEILTVVGARPQFVKAAVLSRYLRDRGESRGFRERLVHTGQHYDENMSEVFFRELDIPRPETNLEVGSGSHGKMTGEMLARLEELMLERRPDLVLVYGDTNSTLAGALAASKLGIPVVHVEAGLRSYDMSMPEEQNRRLTDHLSSYLFCPTGISAENLGREGIADSSVETPSPDRKRVSVVGDIMYEASLHYRRIASERGPTPGIARGDGFALLTIHRAENTDDSSRLASIVRALNSRPELRFVFPVHPRTRKILDRLGLALGEHVEMIDPVGYLDMIALEDSCDLVVTDSGGVQKEAYFFGKPCITLRDATEWVELVDSGWNTLVGADPERISAALSSFRSPSDRPPLYGDGRCAEKIIGILEKGVRA